MPRGQGSRGPSPRWLCNETIDAGTRRWAVEGLAYLTFDADVKEEFVEDKAAMQAMFHLAKVRAEHWGGGAGWWAPWLWGNVPEGVVGLMLWRWGVWKGPVVLGGLESRPLLSIVDVMGAPLSLQSEDRSVLYAVASTLVNCTNSYDHEEPDPQMLELAKYAKQHIPEQHPKVSGAQLFSGPAGSPGHGERLGGTEPGVPSGDRVSLGPSGVRWETSQRVAAGGRLVPPSRAVTLPLGQDKPDFVKRRVRKLLTAGVVSALACMVKSENPALTNSCRELISRYGRAGGWQGGTWVLRLPLSSW